MKKHIQLAALENFRNQIEFGDDIDISLILDLPTRNITKATLSRLDRVLDKMIEDAESKI
jgi:predicted metal-dependent TIM-barrel fold hydrolase